MLAICSSAAAKLVREGVEAVVRFCCMILSFHQRVSVDRCDKSLLRCCVVYVSQVSVSARCGCLSSHRGKNEHGTPLPFRAVVVDLASAARRLVGVATRSPGGSPSRQSITRDS